MADNVLEASRARQIVGYGLIANRPAAGAQGDLYYATDEKQFYTYNGGWEFIDAKKIADSLANRPTDSYCDTGTIFRASDNSQIQMNIGGAWEWIGGCCAYAGSYTGNGAASRQITLGFKPDIVIITGNAVATIGWTVHFVFQDSPNYCLCLNDTGGCMVDDRDEPYLHATDGFVLGGAAAGANRASVDYTYVALKVH